MLNNSEVFNRNIINSSIDKNILSGLSMSYSDGQMTSGYADSIEKLSKNYNEATAEANALRMAQDGLSKSTTEDILAKQNWSKAEIDAAVSSNAFKTAQTTSTAAINADTGATLANVVATKALSAAKKALSVVGGIAFATAISFGISALVKFADSLITTKKELREASKASKQTIDDIKSSFKILKDTINDIKGRYAELAQGVDLISNKNIKLSTEDYEEFLNLSNQLSELFPELTKGYDSNGNAILDLSGNVNTIVGSLDNLIEKEQQLLNKQILKELPEIYTGYKVNYDQYNEDLNKLDEKNQQLKDLMDVGYSIFKPDESKNVILRWKFSGEIDENSLSDMENHLYNVLDSMSDGLSDSIVEHVDQETNDKTLTIVIPKVEYEESGGIESAFGEYIADINGDIQLAKAELEKETSEFNQYLSTWLNDTAVYQGMSDNMKDVLNDIVFDGNWLEEAFKDPKVDENSFESLANWLENNYLNVVGKVNNDEIQSKLMKLFSIDDPQLKINLAQELQDYFDKHNIKISLDFILDKENDDSIANLVERVKTKNNELVGSVDELKQKYDDAKQSRENLYADTNYVGNVDINNRPIVVDSKKDRYKTSHTGFQEYWKGDEETGHYEIIHFTPILPDGTVLDDKTLYNYLDNIIAKADNALETDSPENGGLGILYKVDISVGGEKITDKNLDNAFVQAENWDVSMHEQQEAIYNKEAEALLAYNKALDEQTKLNQFFELYSIDTEDEYNEWLRLTNGVNSTAEAMERYKEAKELVNQEDIDFLGDDSNIEAIDKYKNSISDLGGYLEKIISDEKLSADDVSKLNIEYGILADSLTGYQSEIIAQMNSLAANSEVLTTLSNAIANCNDEAEKDKLQSLYDSLVLFNTEVQDAANSAYNLEKSVSTLESSASLLRELDELINSQGYIDTSRANEIAAQFPEMTDKVAEFNAGLITSRELFNLLAEAYETDEHNYAKAVAFKLRYNEEYFSSFVEKLPKWVKDLAESYNVDLANYKNLNEQKLALDKEYARRKGVLEKANAKAANAVLRFENSGDIRDEKLAIIALQQKKEIESSFNAINQIIEGISDSFTIDTNWKTFGLNEDKGSGGSGRNNGSGDSAKSTTEIDWAEQSLDILQDKVNECQTTLENTKGLTKQLEAINNLNSALGELRDGYQSAYREYKKRYENSVSSLNPNIRKKIESGESFNLSEYSSEYAERIKTAIDNYNKMNEAKDKYYEIKNQISDNENLEKSKLMQESYEAQLDTINTKLKDQSLTAKEKNKLLKKQLSLQNAINAELKKQATYEKDYETVSKLNTEDKNNKLQNYLDRLENYKDNNQNYIDLYEEKLKDTSLSYSDVRASRKSLRKTTNKDFEYQFKEIIDSIGSKDWDKYIYSLKKKYSETKMSDEKFIKKHLEEIANNFDYIGMAKLYQEYLNSEANYKKTNYDIRKNTRSYYINNAENGIKDIQNDIETQGGRGTEEQFNNLETLYNNSREYWIKQKEDVEAMLETCKKGTSDWDEWNNEIQECENNIAECNKNIKECYVSILKLPLNNVEDALKEIENRLDAINDSLADQDTYISAATGILDLEIENQQVLKEAIQDKIDALQKENELRETNLAVQKAEYELEKLKNQKNSKVFYEGQGWQYESNPDDVRNAQEAYDEALYNKKIYLLNEQIGVYDDEIERLNKIKETWNNISSQVQFIHDLNKALTYDSEFYTKVLINDLNLINSISAAYSSIVAQKTTYEAQQKDYITLQDVINDTVDLYNLEGITFDEAKQKIANAVKIYYPEIVAQYEKEAETLDKVAEKKLKDAGVTEKTSEKVLEDITTSNEKIVESYNELLTDLDDVFKELNSLLSSFSNSAKTMATSVNKYINSIKSSLNSLSTTDFNVNVSANGKVKTAGKSHSGLELGYLGENNVSRDKEAFKYIALSDLDNDEIVRVLQKGEGVITQNQITQTMDNFRKLAQVKVPTIPFNEQIVTQSVNFNGDIVVQSNNGDINSFAKSIKQNLPSAMLQQLYINK